MGALSRADTRIPVATDDKVAAIFYGRPVLNVGFFCRVGGRLPGTDPHTIARQLLGEVPGGISSESSRRRLPVVAAKLPYALASIKRDVLVRTAPTDLWWRESIARLDSMDLSAAQGALIEGRNQFVEMARVQAGAAFIGVQPIYEQLLALVKKASLEPAEANALVAGHGAHVETDIIRDLWALAREDLTLDTFLARHGYHGPLEGEISGKVWREDPTPVLQLVRQYKARDGADPAEAAIARTTARVEAERRLLAKLPRLQRPFAQMMLKTAVARIPLRGVAKAAYLQSLDVARGAARRVGDHLADRGMLENSEDAFYLTLDELTNGLPANAVELVADRRAQRASFEGLTLPPHWRGNPRPSIASAELSEEQTARASVTGIGASGGTVEGIVRVVDDPTFSDVEADEVLVCKTTDPSWASVMYFSSALVVDVGGLLSHAAVVAREVGVPCVIGTGDGTQVLRTGDRVRVDGNAGTVEILQRADQAALARALEH
jgi:pyruvate,water dikinase